MHSWNRVAIPIAKANVENLQGLFRPESDVDDQMGAG